MLFYSEYVEMMPVKVLSIKYINITLDEALYIFVMITDTSFPENTSQNTKLMTNQDLDKIFFIQPVYLLLPWLQ